MAGDRAAHDVWTIGAGYEAYVGRWSRPVARELLRWLAVPPGCRWLDVGCGAGALVETILQHAAPRTVVAIDRSPGFVRHARDRVRDARASFQVGDAQALPFASSVFDGVVSGLVVNFVPDPALMAAEMRRVARRGGAVALYVWDYSAGMRLMRIFWDAARALDARAADLDEAVRFPICAPARLAGLAEAAGLTSVETRAIDVPTRFHDFDDCWSPFLAGQGPAPGYVTSLSEDRQLALRERVRAALPFEADGSIPLTARAWAVRGVVTGGS